MFPRPPSRGEGRTGLFPPPSLADFARVGRGYHRSFRRFVMRDRRQYNLLLTDNTNA